MPSYGQKDFSELGSYDPTAVEPFWNAYWEQNGCYEADSEDGKEPFVMCLPPPNVTGHLHIGHGFMAAIEDAIARTHRMQGRSVLWIPGTDHAGIATQSVVERRLQRDEGKTRHDLGREAFLERTWQWTKDHGGHICEQMRRLGCSLDWSRQFFTLDEDRNKAVIEAFCQLHAKGKIYRSRRLVGWSSALNSAISDAEIDKKEIKNPTFLPVPGHARNIEFGVLHKFAYRLVDNPEEMVIVGTTRIETMLGDVAVAVHPEDERYKHLHGKLLQHPFCDRQIPIITDAELVDMEFGTGCVKITPAHDHNDFECGKRHNLEQIDVLTDDGRINDNGGRFAGMMRFDARYKIIEALEAEGLFMGKEKNEMELPVCSRSGDVIEPRVKPQWYVDCADAAARAIDYVESGDLQISPDTGKRDFVHTWLGKIRPWCVSRQLWWGHRIPAWRVIVDGVRAEDDCDQTHWVIAHDEQEALKIASERFPGRELQLEQDPDVLDTWFSSGLLPFSSLGWPEQDSVDFQKYYPNTLLETGGDILFFWVARMVMMGIMLTEQLPFKQVFLHPLVRDKDGAKISKSKGNVIDPLHIINGVSLETLLSELENGNLPEKEVVKAQKAKKKEFPKGIPTCGADALRFGLLEFTTPTGRNVNLNINRVIGTRHFCNKIWNATRFSLRNFAEDFEPVAVEELDTSTLSVADKWILSRLAKCVETVNTAFETYHFAESTSAVYQFFTTELCDVYLELLKPVFTSGSPAAQLAAQQTLFLCLETSLLLMHPMMPFVTEELYHFLPKRAEAAPLMLETYPQSAQWASLVDDAAEASLALAQKVAGAARSTRESLNLDNKLRPQLFALCQSEEMATQLAPLTDSVSTLASASSLEVLTDESDERLRQCALSVVSSSLSLYTHVAGCGLNVAAEIKKVAKKQSKLQKICEKLEKKFQNAKYMEKAPEAQKLQDQAKLAEYQAQIAELGTSLRQLQVLDAAEQAA